MHKITEYGRRAHAFASVVLAISFDTLHGELIACEMHNVESWNVFAMYEYLAPRAPKTQSRETHEAPTSVP